MHALSMLQIIDAMNGKIFDKNSQLTFAICTVRGHWVFNTFTVKFYCQCSEHCHIHGKKHIISQLKLTMWIALHHFLDCRCSFHLSLLKWQWQILDNCNLAMATSMSPMMCKGVLIGSILCTNAQMSFHWHIPPHHWTNHCPLHIQN